MDYSNQQAEIIRKGFANGKYTKCTKLQKVSIRDVPLEVRRKEARRPLFLRRYE